MAYYHSQGAAKALREKLDKEALLKNLQVRARYADDSERQELENRIQELRSELNKL